MHTGGLVQGGQMQLIRLIRKGRRKNMGMMCEDNKTHTRRDSFKIKQEKQNINTDIDTEVINSHTRANHGLRNVDVQNLEPNIKSDLSSN